MPKFAILDLLEEVQANYLKTQTLGVLWLFWGILEGFYQKDELTKRVLKNYRFDRVIRVIKEVPV